MSNSKITLQDIHVINGIYSYPDLHLKLSTTNTHSLHQIHITREIHQLYTFLKSDFIHRNYTVYSEYFGVYSTYTLYTKNTRVIPEYVSAGYTPNITCSFRGCVGRKSCPCPHDVYSPVNYTFFYKIFAPF